MKLVLLDLDNTLIDANYRLTASEKECRIVVQKLAKKGICVGLCSDSAVVTLRQWANRLGLTGPIVAERGAVVWDPIQQIEIVLNIQKTAWFSGLRESFVKIVLENFPDATIMIGDATRFIKDRPVSAAVTQRVFAVNGFRKASFSFFACRPKNDRSMLEPDPELLKLASAFTAEIVTTYGNRKEDLFWDENPQYGILIVHARVTEKHCGISALSDRLKPDQLIMVGDSMSDFLGLPYVMQYAVGNADPRYKSKAVFIAESPHTEGVLECLRHCSAQ